MKDSTAKDVSHHIYKVTGMFDEIITHLRQDIEKMDDPQAKAMFETSAEVIIGLKKAFAHYEEGDEKAWKRDSKRIWRPI